MCNEVATDLETKVMMNLKGYTKYLAKKDPKPM